MVTKTISTKSALLVCLSLVAVSNAWVFKDFLLFRKLYVFLDVGSDSLAIGLPHIVYISNFLKNGTFPLWSHGIGIGQSTLALNHTLFDPLNWMIFYLPQSIIPFMIGYLVWIKSLIASAAFFSLCKKLEISNYSAILGSLIYSLNGYLVLWGQHYVFGLAIIYFPFILLGIEMWLSDRKPAILLVILFLTGIWSYYFLYMMTIFLAPYTLYRIFNKKTPDQSSLKSIIETSFVYLLGLGLSAFIFIPSLAVAIDGPRVGGQTSNIPFFASHEYYISLITRFFSNHAKIGNHYFYEWWNMYEIPNVYCSVLSLILIFVAFFCYPKEKKIPLFLATCLLSISFLLPSFGLLANAFSYVSYRWTFAVIPIMLLFALRGLDHVLSSKTFDKKQLFKAFAVVSLPATVTIIIAPSALGWSNILFTDQLVSVSQIISLFMFYTFFVFFFSFNKNIQIWKSILIYPITL